MMQVSQTIRLIAPAIVLFFLHGCGQSETQIPAGADNNVKVGAIVFLTGPQAALGAEVKNAMELAVADTNKEAGPDGKQIELIIEDSKDQPKDAILAFNRLQSAGCPVIVSTGDVVSLNLAPLAKSSQLPLICTVAAGPDIIKNNDWVFRVFIQAQRQADVMAGFTADKLKAKTAGVLYINNEFGIATEQSFKHVFEKAGGQVVSSQAFGIADKDVRSQLQRITASKPEAIFISGFGPAYTSSIRQLKELGYPGKIVTVSTIAIPYFLQQTAPANEGVYYPGTAFDGKPSPQAKIFSAAYTKQYKQEPSFVAAFAYDALRLTKLALQKSQQTSTSIHESLPKVEMKDGLVGSVRFAENGDADFPLIVKRIEHGQGIAVQ